MTRRLALAALFLIVVTAAARAGSDPQRERISREYAAYVERRYGVVDADAPNERIAAIVQRLLVAVEEPNYSWRFRILNNPEPNAFALPNGFIYIHSGLLEMKLEPGTEGEGDERIPTDISDDEIAFVLGHEITHVVRNHSMRLAQADRNLMNVLRRTGIGRSPLDRVVGGVFDQMISSGFSREMETESDEWGLRYMADAGFRPKASLEFFERLKRLEGGRTKFRLFRSHPRSADRFKNVKRWLAGIPQEIEPPGVFNGAPKDGLPMVYVPLKALPRQTGAQSVRGPTLKEPAEFATRPSESVVVVDTPAPDLVEELARRMKWLRQGFNVTARPLPAPDADLTSVAREQSADVVVQVSVDHFTHDKMPWPGGTVAKLELALEVRVLSADGTPLAPAIPLTVRREATLQAGESSYDALYDTLLKDAAEKLEDPVTKALKPLKRPPAPAPADPPK
ncbi:MAG: hypothetical protein FJX76_06155 [Armatimonadetes bacterium]|nr:hypothetical protein [Armatimonadota bacterium]